MDWPGLLRLGLTGLRLAPEAFWRLTPRELAILLGDGGGAEPMARARLDELTRAFPDKDRGT